MLDISQEIEKERVSKKSGIMQYPNELLSFMEFIKNHGVRTYLEIGVKRGHLAVFMKRVLELETVYACDIKRPEYFDEHPEIIFFHGSSHSDKYLRWRKKIGMIDMILIDADHKYKPAKKDYEREVNMPHRFLALHDIANTGYPDLRKLWKKNVKGEKIEFVNDDKSSRLLCIEHKDKDYMNKHKRKYGNSCGIGVSWTSI